MNPLVIDGLILFVLLVLSGFFSGIELAYFSLPKIRVKELVQEGRQGAHLVEELKSKPQKLLITILIGNNLVNIGAASYATVVATNLFGDSGVGIATGAMTFLVLILGEITPKSFCSKHAARISLKLAPVVYGLSWILTPISAPLESLVTLLTGKEKISPLVTEEKMKKLAQIGIEEGTVAQSESEMITNIFRLHDLTAWDLCTPINQTTMINGDEDIQDIAHHVLHSPYSRFPVYKQRIDNVVGIVHKDDLLIALKDDLDEEPVTTIMRMAHFCQDTINAHVLLRKMQALRTHIWIVKAQGTAMGMITMEDILEELVGDILDETDLEEQLIRRISKTQILALGKTKVVDINNYFNVSLKSNDTIAEYLNNIFEHTPKKGEEIQIANITFAIIEAKKGMVKVVKITKN